MIHYADEAEDTDLFAEVERRGIPYDHHETDLYIPVTPETQELINNYRFKKNVERFQSNIAPHVMWFDIPFAYTPAWKKKQRGAHEEVAGGSNFDEFMRAYAENLHRAVTEYPDEYSYPLDEVPKVVERMADAIRRGSFNKDSRALKWTTKQLGIPHTYKAIKEFLGI